MTGTLGANAIMVLDAVHGRAEAGEEGPHAQGIRYMELKAQPRSRLHNLHSELPQAAEGWR
jgi:hypothetical protein